MIIKHDFGNANARRLAEADQSPAQLAPLRTLMVGFGGLESFLDLETPGASTRFMSCNRFLALSGADFAACAPSLMLTPLVCGRLDAIDFAHKLAALGYAGRYLAVVERLPNVSIVRREIRASCPGIDFDIRELGALDLPAFRQGA